MQNGDSLNAQAWYNEIVILPFPDSDSLYYVFTVGVTSFYGLYYSIVDISANSGMGTVIQKNGQLQSFANADCLNAIKHGNGRDWWVIFRKSDVPTGGSNNDFYQYLITPNGISNVFIQSVGSLSYTNLGKLTFSPLGGKLAFVTYAGLVEIYDFNRCTGIISNPINVFQETMGSASHFWGCEFSPNGNILYVTISDQSSYLFQFDLTAANIAASIDTIWTISFPSEGIGSLKRGPDNKIYGSGPYTNPSVFIYPYPDSMYNMYNMNLGVINYPDSLGTACDFQPYSFYLGGKRTYWGLPNNPDYDMGPLAGSPCDTLTGIFNGEPQTANNELLLTYAPEWEKLFVNARGLGGRKCLLRLFDANGKVVYSLEKQTQPPYFTRDVDMRALARGMYVVGLDTEKESLRKKFVKP